MEKLRRKIESLATGFAGKMGVAVRNVETGEEIGIHEREFFPMASVCKIPILVETYRQADAGILSLDERIEITEDSRTPGSGLLNFCNTGLKPTLRDLTLLMIVVSDNAATDLILERIGGPAAVTQSMRNLGLTDIRLDRGINDLISDISVAMDPLFADKSYQEIEKLYLERPELISRMREPERIGMGMRKATCDKDIATPLDINRLCARIARNECASPSSCLEILKTLERQQLRTRLPRELPTYTKVCHKTGTLGSGAVSNDSGLIYVGEKPIAVTVLSKEIQQEARLTNTVIAEIGRAVYDYFSS